MFPNSGTLPGLADGRRPADQGLGTAKIGEQIADVLVTFSIEQALGHEGEAGRFDFDDALRSMATFGPSRPRSTTNWSFFSARKPLRERPSLVWTRLYS